MERRGGGLGPDNGRIIVVVQDGCGRQLRQRFSDRGQGQSWRIEGLLRRPTWRGAGAGAEDGGEAAVTSTYRCPRR